MAMRTEMAEIAIKISLINFTERLAAANFYIPALTYITNGELQKSGEKSASGLM